MIATAVRLTFKQYRFELTALALVGVVLLVAQGLAALLLGQLAGEGCLDFDPPASCLGKTDIAIATLSISTAAVVVTVVFPITIAALLGVQLVGREVERATAVLPWTLGPSRVRWFLIRVAFLTVVIGGVSLALGLAADLVLLARSPGLELANSLTEWETRGWLIPARAIAVFGIALAVGAAMGRVLPAFAGCLHRRRRRRGRSPGFRGVASNGSGTACRRRHLCRRTLPGPRHRCLPDLRTGKRDLALRGTWV